MMESAPVVLQDAHGCGGYHREEGGPQHCRLAIGQQEGHQRRRCRQGVCRSGRVGTQSVAVHTSGRAGG